MLLVPSLWWPGHWHSYTHRQAQEDRLWTQLSCQRGSVPPGSTRQIKVRSSVKVARNIQSFIRTSGRTQTSTLKWTDPKNQDGAVRFLTALDINVQYDYVWIVLIKNRKPDKPTALSAVSHSACMSIIKVCTQLWVLHLWSVKIYESQKWKICSSLSLSGPLSSHLSSNSLHLRPLWSFPPGSAGPSWQRGTGQALSVCVTLCYSSACVCACVSSPLQWKIEESRPVRSVGR